MSYEKRYVVKIWADKCQQSLRAVYFRKDLTFDMIVKWRWYFEYRAALYRVQNPKHYCRLEITGYDYTPPVDVQDKKFKDSIKSKKAQITKYETNIKLAKKEWVELFPIEENELYQKCIQKINKLKFELNGIEIQYKEFLNETHR